MWVPLQSHVPAQQCMFKNSICVTVLMLQMSKPGSENLQFAEKQNSPNSTPNYVFSMFVNVLFCQKIVMANHLF